MITFTSATDPLLSNLPPPIRYVILTHLRTLVEIFGREPDRYHDGFVGYVEAEDTPQSLCSETGRDISDLESAFRDGPFLIGVLLWGNSGAGVTLVCPDREGYASEIAQALSDNV